MINTLKEAPASPNRQRSCADLGVPGNKTYPRILGAEVASFEQQSLDLSRWTMRASISVELNPGVFQTIGDVVCYPVREGVSFSRDGATFSPDRGFGLLMRVFGVDDFFGDSEAKDYFLRQLLDVRRSLASAWSRRPALSVITEVIDIVFSDAHWGPVVVDLRVQNIHGDVLIFRGVRLIHVASMSMSFGSCSTAAETKRFVAAFGAMHTRDVVFRNALVPLLLAVGSVHNRGYLEMCNTETGEYHLMPGGIFLDAERAAQAMMRLECFGLREMRVVRGALTANRSVHCYGRKVSTL